MARLRAVFLLLFLSASFAGLGLVAHAEPDAGTEVPDATPHEAPSEAYKPRPSQFGKGPRDVRIEAGADREVVTLKVDGTIDLGLVAMLERTLEKHPKAAAILLDVNTLGGRVDAAIQIRDALLASKVKTIAYVHPRAISAGALISFACDVIAISPGGSIGAATPIQLEGGQAKSVGEKMVSYFRAEMRATAEAKGRRGDVAEAMVDASVVIDGLDDEHKLLTLDTEGALTVGMADFGADSIDAVLAKVGLPKQPRVTVSENWAELLVRFCTDPVVSSVLMILGLLGIVIEIYTPGFGVPGALGVLCLSLFFGGHLLVNLAGLEELILFTLGVGLLALEAFVIPGFGVAGIAGLVCIVAGLLLSLVGLPIDVVLRTGAWAEPLVRVLWSLVITVALMLVAVRFLPRTRQGRKLVLQSATTKGAGFVSTDEPRELLGKDGVADTDLRPVGVALFGEARVDVVSEGPFIARGTSVRVIEVEGARVVVRTRAAGIVGGDEAL